MYTVTAPDGDNLACFHAGSGPALLLVHGAISDQTVWDPIRPVLERRFTVYAVNRRGREGSAVLRSGSMEREFRDIAAVVDAIGAPVHLLGHSFGAICALGAALYTDRLRSVALYEPPALDPGLDRVAETLRVVLNRDGPEAALRLFLAAGPGESQEIIDRLAQSRLWPTMLALIPTTPLELEAMAKFEFDLERFRRIAYPVFYLLGTESPSHFRVIADALAGILPDRRLVELKDQSHFANILAPETFASAVLRFLEQVEER